MKDSKMIMVIADIMFKRYLSDIKMVRPKSIKLVNMRFEEGELPQINEFLMVENAAKWCELKASTFRN